MTHSYHEIAFTPTVLELQFQAGSREGYASMSEGSRYANLLTERESGFIAERDSFYMASVSETGWPYVQHRGGPKGFMKVLDEKTIGFLDYSGNRQYVSTGNFRKDDRVSLFFMDYPNCRRLKMLGRVRIVDSHETDILEQLEDRDYAVQIERAFLISIEGFDWNCPAHITPRFTEDEVRAGVEKLVEENRHLKLAVNNTPSDEGSAGHETTVLGEGPLELVVCGMRQLAPQIRAYELCHPEGKHLPPVAAGAHLQIPVRLPGGELAERHYSIASNPARPDVYEIAVLREEHGRGGSQAVHDSFAIGTVLRTGRPENHFPLHEGGTPAVLIAGGIGITAIKPMAQTLEARGAEFELHYAGKNRRGMAFLDRLERQLGDRITVYAGADGQRMDFEAVLQDALEGAFIYVCGPDRLIAGVMAAAIKVAFPRNRIRLERFA